MGSLLGCDEAENESVNASKVHSYSNAKRLATTSHTTSQNYPPIIYTHASIYDYDECSPGAHGYGYGENSYKFKGYDQDANSESKDEAEDEDEEFDEKNRRLGGYQCGDCGSYWQSVNSWKGHGQNCFHCGSYTMPYELNALERGIAYFECEYCENFWTNEKNFMRRKCNNCGRMSTPIKKKKDKRRSGKDYRKYGYFECEKCYRRWESAFSWRDYGEECKKCRITMIAYDESDLAPSGSKIDPLKHHEKELCERCQKGLYCIKPSYINRTKYR